MILVVKDLDTHSLLWVWVLGGALANSRTFDSYSPSM